MLHIVARGIKTAEYKKKEDKLKVLAGEASNKYDIEVDYQLIPGTIFTAIAEYVNEHDPNLVVMGTHGLKGMQKLTKSEK